MEETKRYYLIKLEVIAPITLTYRVLAENPEEALEIVIKKPNTTLQTSQPKFKFALMKKIKASIYLAGTSMIEFVKNF